MSTTATSDGRQDLDLVVAARNGDREAFAVLYQRYFNPVFDFATRMVRDRDEAADIVQETFIRAFERLDSLKDGQRFKSWVFTIARNETLDRLRRSRRLRPLVTTDEAGEEYALDVVDPERLSDPALAAEANASAALVWQAAAGLDPRQLSILDLHLRQGLSGAEIADVLGVSHNNGYVMLNRLKAAVQSTIEGFLLLRQGREACTELAGLVGEFETDAMSPKLRRAIDRHSERCETCTAQRRRLVEPLAVFAAFVPLTPAPGLSSDLLDRILDQSEALPPVELSLAPLTPGDDDDLDLDPFEVDIDDEPSTLVTLEVNADDAPDVGWGDLLHHDALDVLDLLGDLDPFDEIDLDPDP